MKTKSIFFVLAVSLSGMSQALMAITGRVTDVEATYLPGAVSFTMDAGSAQCPAGTWLTWQKPDVENNKAAYAMLLTALTSGKSIVLFMNDGDTTCKGQYLHIRSI